MKLFIIGKDLFVLNYKERKAIILDGLPELFMTAKQLEIPFDELEYGLVECHKNDHNMIEFGSAKKSFMFSSKV